MHNPTIAKDLPPPAPRRQKGQKQPGPGGSMQTMNSLTLVKGEPPRLYETATGVPLDFYNEFTEHLWDDRHQLCA